MSKVLKYAQRKDLRCIYLALFFVLVSVSAGIIPYFLVNNLIISLINNELSKIVIIQTTFIIVCLLVLKSIAHGVGLMFSHHGAFNVLSSMRKHFAQKLSNQSLAEINMYGTGYYKKKFVEDIGSMEVTLAHIIPEMIPNILVPVIVIIIIFIYDWRMGLLSLGSIPFGIIPMGLMMSVGIKKMPKYYESQASLNNTIIEYISGMKVVKIFNQTTASYAKYISSVNSYKDYALDWNRECWKNMAIVTIVLPCAIVLSFPVGMYLYYIHAISLEVFIFTLMLNLSIGVPLNKVLLFMPFFPQISFVMNDLEKSFTIKPLKTGNKQAINQDITICYDHVNFAYEKKNVLTDISFKIKPNSFVAIVGPSGGGKSTLVKLLIHYYDLSKGEIKLNNINIEEFSMEALMEMISYVSQDNFLFNDTIMENIRFGNLQATDEEVLIAAEKAACTSFINQLPNGFLTNIGDSGNKLSGGEKQRITIARAILKNSPILVLDEATAYADAENEDLIQIALSELMKNKTVIVIAHRLRNIIDADQIIYVDQGVIKAQGTHNELLNSCFDYQKLWSLNEQSYNWELEV